jgi:hypothetical protein
VCFKGLSAWRGMMWLVISELDRVCKKRSQLKGTAVTVTGRPGDATVRSAGVPAHIGTQHLPDTSLESPFNRPVQSLNG